MRYRAMWNGQVLAESDDTIKVEGNQYFPIESVRLDYFTSSNTHTTCPWKGVASYYHVSVDGKTNKDAAWFYPKPSPAAREIQGHVAFWRGVRVQPVRDAADGASGEAERPSSWWRRLLSKTSS